jgi:hypothetical protein
MPFSLGQLACTQQEKCPGADRISNFMTTSLTQTAKKLLGLKVPINNPKNTLAPQLL